MGDLRISLTDRYNFRCLYCLPKTEAAANFYQERFAPKGRSFSTEPIARKWQPREKLLTYEEIERTVGIFVRLGINKIRLTGGEPLLRRDVNKLVQCLVNLPGIDDLALTTNGFNFHEKSGALRKAGLKHITFSLDSLDRDNFKKITGQDCLDTVVSNIRLARDLGMAPVKVNAVIIRDINDHEIEVLAEFAVKENVILRFIEFMPLESGRAWLKEIVVPGREIRERLQNSFQLEPLNANHTAETANRWRIAGTTGEIGIIAPVTEAFCGHCNRIRLTSDGKIRTCLSSLNEPDLREKLRGGESDEVITNWIRKVVWNKEERHHIGEPELEQPERSMSCIGG